jgi:NAD(P)H dehydrogenase (quinone)
VALCAATCLLEPSLHDGAVYEISGPELLSFRDIAALAAEINDVPIEYVPVTPEERLAMFDAMGVPRTFKEGAAAHPDAHMWASDEMISADLAFAQGYHAILSHHVTFITGRQPHTLRAVFEYCRGKSYEDC